MLATQAGRFFEAHLDQFLLCFISIRRPSYRFLSRWTCHALISPIYLEATQIEAAFGLFLPMVILARWPNNPDPALLLTFNKQKCINISPVEKMLARQKLLLR